MIFMTETCTDSKVILKMSGTCCKTSPKNKTITAPCALSELDGIRFNSNNLSSFRTLIHHEWWSLGDTGSLIVILSNLTEFDLLRSSWKFLWKLMRTSDITSKKKRTSSFSLQTFLWFRLNSRNFFRIKKILRSYPKDFLFKRWCGF